MAEVIVEEGYNPLGSNLSDADTKGDQNDSDIDDDINAVTNDEVNALLAEVLHNNKNEKKSSTSTGVHVKQEQKHAKKSGTGTEVPTTVFDVLKQQREMELKQKQHKHKHKKSSGNVTPPLDSSSLTPYKDDLDYLNDHFKVISARIHIHSVENEEKSSFRFEKTKPEMVIRGFRAKERQVLV